MYCKLSQKFFIFLFFILLFFQKYSIAQLPFIEGSVFEYSENQSRKSALTGASVFWQGTTIGTASDIKGQFKLNVVGELPKNLIISFVGFQTDTIVVSSLNKLTIFLKPAISISEVSIEGRQDATLISTIKPINSEQNRTKGIAQSCLLQSF